MNDEEQLKKVMNDTSENIDERKIVKDENLKVHPEITRSKTKAIKKRKSYRFFQRVPKSFVERMNQPIYTHIILGVAAFLSIINIAFGIFGILAIFGLKENNSWLLFEKMAIFGWEQLKITGFILIIIGVVMFWSIPYYFKNKTQQADSYLVIGSGISLLFGVIYLLIIIADIISALVESINTGNTIEIVTYFYLPIMLATVAFPLFRVLVIRHMIVLPDLLIEDDEISEEEIYYRGRGHFFRKRGNHRYYHDRGKRFRGKHWRDWEKK